jgi:type III secretory pathway lipoprotein EscJ
MYIIQEAASEETASLVFGITDLIKNSLPGVSYSTISIILNGTLIIDS